MYVYVYVCAYMYVSKPCKFACCDVVDTEQQQDLEWESLPSFYFAFAFTHVTYPLNLSHNQVLFLWPGGNVAEGERMGGIYVWQSTNLFALFFGLKFRKLTSSSSSQLPQCASKFPK